MTIAAIHLKVRQEQELPIKTALSKFPPKCQIHMNADNFSAGSHIRKVGSTIKNSGSCGSHTSNIKVQSDHTQANFNGRKRQNSIETLEILKSPFSQGRFRSASS